MKLSARGEDHSGALCGLVASLEAHPPRDAVEAAERLGAAKLAAGDLMAWSDLEHADTDSYGRRLVHQSARFELMVMSWRPGDYSAIHDHGAAEWGAVRYFGAADHVSFDLSAGQLAIQSRATTRLDALLCVEPSLIHLMGNAGQTSFVSLHLYGASEAQTHAITRGARIYDLFEDRIQRTDGGVFFCLPEAQIQSRESGPKAGPETLRLHHALMRNRARAMGNARRVAALDASLAGLDEVSA